MFACIYFYFISKYWLWFEIFGWSLNLLVVLCLYWIPDSPKSLVSRKRFDEARKALKYIANVNHRGNEDMQTQIDSFIFEGEIVDPLKPVSEEKVLTGSLKDLI